MQALRFFKTNPNEDFVKVKDSMGLEAATFYAHFYFSNQRSFKNFRHGLKFHSEGMDPLHSQYDVLLVMPPSSLLNKKKVAFVSRCCSLLAVSAGFRSVSHAHLETNSVLDGASDLRQIILKRQKMGSRLILVSFSYGSAFLRVALDLLGSGGIHSIKGWFNISGLVFGSPRFHGSARGFYYDYLSGRSDFSSEHKYFSSHWDSPVKTVHVLAMGGRTFLEKTHQNFLERWGPNDGLICFADYQNAKGPVISLPGQNHFVDMRVIDSVYIRSLSSMVNSHRDDVRRPSWQKTGFPPESRRWTSTTEAPL